MHRWHPQQSYVALGSKGDRVGRRSGGEVFAEAFAGAQSRYGQILAIVRRGKQSNIATEDQGAALEGFLGGVKKFAESKFSQFEVGQIVWLQSDLEAGLFVEPLGGGLLWLAGVLSGAVFHLNREWNGQTFAASQVP